MNQLPARLRDTLEIDTGACLRLRSLTRGDLAALPVGALRLAADGRVLAWRPPVDAPDPAPTTDPVGRHFLSDIAPAELGRSIGPAFARGVAGDGLNLTVEYCVAGELQPSLWLHLRGNRCDGFLLVLRRIG